MKKKANQPKHKVADQTTAKPAAQISDLPPTSVQAEQVKGGPTQQSKRTVVLKSSFGDDSADE